MRILLGVFALVISLAAYGCTWALIGYRKGYRQGRQDADKWWTDKDRQVDEERQKIWREEGMNL